MIAKKRFKDNKAEWELSITMSNSFYEGNIYWYFSLKKKEVGKRKWQIVEPNIQIDKNHSAQIAMEKRTRYLIKMVPLEWWKETFETLQENMKTNFDFNLNKLYLK